MSSVPAYDSSLYVDVSNAARWMECTDPTVRKYIADGELRALSGDDPRNPTNKTQVLLADARTFTARKAARESGMIELDDPKVAQILMQHGAYTDLLERVVDAKIDVIAQKSVLEQELRAQIRDLKVQLAAVLEVQEIDAARRRAALLSSLD